MRIDIFQCGSSEFMQFGLMPYVYGLQIDQTPLGSGGILTDITIQIRLPRNALGHAILEGLTTRTYTVICNGEPETYQYNSSHTKESRDVVLKITRFSNE